MEFVFLFYIFLSFVATTGGAYILFSTGRMIAAAIYFIGLIVLEIYFGGRWFNGTNLAPAPSGPWPPTINVCPDFLSLTNIKDASGNNIPVCVDTMGVATGLKRWTGPMQTDPSYTFGLYVGRTDAFRSTQLCADAKAKGVTWEGVWDGSTCLGGVPPLPPTA
jgi:hypothetical protein